MQKIYKWTLLILVLILVTIFSYRFYRRHQLSLLKKAPPYLNDLRGKLLNDFKIPFSGVDTVIINDQNLIVTYVVDSKITDSTSLSFISHKFGIVALNYSKKIEDKTKNYIYCDYILEKNNDTTVFSHEYFYHNGGPEGFIRKYVLRKNKWQIISTEIINY